MKIGTTSHPKFKRLMKRLGVNQYEAVGILELLWGMAAQFADDGNLSRFDAESIAAYIGWEKNSDELVTALVECGWLDRSDNNLAIHDWADHMPNFLLDRRRKREQRDANRLGKDGKSSTCPGHSRNVTGQSYPTKPSPTKPSPTKPRKESANAEAVKPEEVFDYWNRSKATTKARKLTDSRKRAIQLRLRDPDWPWREAIDLLPIPNRPGFKWQPDIDWLVESDKHAYNIVEGKYGDNDTALPSPTAFSETDYLVEMSRARRSAK